MIKQKDFDIAFKGLKQGKHSFEFKIRQAFFDLYDYKEFENAQLLVQVELNKLSTMLELNFRIGGTVEVLCDISNESFDMPLEAEMELLVKFGETFNDENEEVLVIPHGEFKVNVSQYIYEMAVLAIPSKRIHPGIEDGSLESDMVDRLKALQPKEETTTEETDPRWDALKKLLKENDK
ncbi:MAG: DUF177 domain-containing protein [Flavobacteriaceae bacterium]|nr:DUF177 domain-containing protein [Flavobacteriaceae bacterium]